MTCKSFDKKILQQLVSIGYEKNIIQILYSQDYNEDGCKGIICQIGNHTFYFAKDKVDTYNNIYDYIRDTTAEENIIDITEAIYRKMQYEFIKFEADYYYNYLYSKIGNIYEAYQLWITLEDVPINENEEIEISWHHFPAGTHREEIWHWFENTFHVSIGNDLINAQY